ncbi:MAG: type 1 glutamine amidotransferase domain-containing protein [Chitinophaga sp.]|uniref:type 1 glutamine amidotransferase domain-containing protein n=1 Tax=Chitinophaga sp. TaxID=1869181 RepID=UPI0025BA6DD5|nr:type 1 glutamine amidotransferase domain-containing protein [Chitinophaga sp.]MBV8253691.1 type 1 glutamine amidotransferase domain-containing protein [Chitinophaga sp.]
MNTNNTHQSKGKKILFVVTSHSDLGNTGEKTGIWIEEFAAPYYFLHDKGVDITIASPAGGAAPIDPKSTDPNAQTEATKRYYSDPATQERLAHTVALSTVKSEDYDAVFYPGGHGPMWDLAEDKTSAALIGAFLHSNKPAALVCHAPVALQHVVDGNGAPFVKGKNVTGFSNSEEAGVKLTTVVPFLLEDMLKSKGAHYQSGPDWQSFSLQDGLLITGQNPASSIAVAEKLLQQVTSK